MRQIALLFCAWILLSPALRATPTEDFTAHGKELLANKEKMSEADRLHRLFVWPSQALGYKIGQLKIRDLRSHAEKELGQKFDVRAFHDEVLKNGALPMSVLENHMKEWVAKGKRA